MGQSGSTNSGYVNISSTNNDEYSDSPSSLHPHIDQVINKFEEVVKIDIYASLNNFNPNKKNEKLENQNHAEILKYYFNQTSFSVHLNPLDPLWICEKTIIDSITINFLDNKTNVPFSLTLENICPIIDINSILNTWLELKINDIEEVHDSFSDSQYGSDFFMLEEMCSSCKLNNIPLTFHFPPISEIMKCNNPIYSHLHKFTEENEQPKNLVLVHSDFLSGAICLSDFFSSIKCDLKYIYLPYQSKIYNFLVKKWECIDFDKKLNVRSSSPAEDTNKTTKTKKLKKSQSKQILDLSDEFMMAEGVGFLYRNIKACLSKPLKESLKLNDEERYACIKMTKHSYISLIQKIFAAYNLKSVIFFKNMERLEISISIDSLHDQILKNVLQGLWNTNEAIQNHQFHIGSVVVKVKGITKKYI